MKTEIVYVYIRYRLNVSRGGNFLRIKVTRSQLDALREGNQNFWLIVERRAHKKLKLSEDDIFFIGREVWEPKNVLPEFRNEVVNLDISNVDIPTESLHAVAYPP